MRRSIRARAALGLTLAAGPALAQAPAPPAEPPSGTVFFPGVLVRPDGRPAHLNDPEHWERTPDKPDPKSRPAPGRTGPPPGR